MNINVYILGEKTSKVYLEGISEYEKRLNRYCKIKLQHFKNKDQLAKKLLDKSYKISVSITGKTISSEELAEKINLLGISGTSNITFILSNENIHSDENISISPMEMDIGITTLIMFEQLYRSYRILTNEPYHK